MCWPKTYTEQGVYILLGKLISQKNSQLLYLCGPCIIKGFTRQVHGTVCQARPTKLLLLCPVQELATLMLWKRGLLTGVHHPWREEQPWCSENARWTCSLRITIAKLWVLEDTQKNIAAHRHQHCPEFGHCYRWFIPAGFSALALCWLLLASKEHREERASPNFLVPLVCASGCCCEKAIPYQNQGAVWNLRWTEVKI